MQALILDSQPVRWALCRAIGTFAPSVSWSRFGNLRLSDIPEPELPGPGWVKLRTVLGGICGTDLAMIRQQNHPATIVRPFTSFPVVLGHENVAIIEATGNEVEGWRAGDRVVVEPALSCVPRGIDPVCPACQAGQFSLCERFLGDDNLPAGTMVGLNCFTSGSWAPRFVAHASQLYAVPDSLSDEEAVAIDPVACSLHAVLRSPPTPGSRVLVQGAGIIGLGVTMALKTLAPECTVIALARHPHQVDMLRARGADEVVLIPRDTRRGERFERVASVFDARRVEASFGNQTLIGGADWVFDCVGSGESLSDAMKFCRSRGTVVAAGTSQISWVDTTSLWFNEITVVGAYGRQMESWEGATRHTYEVVIDLATRGMLNLADLVTHVFDLKDYRKAFTALTGRGRSRALKAAFRHLD